jgi:putative NADH-flavin reductase
MKLVVFGATGRTGRLVVQQALDQGYTVVAFVRDPAKVPDQNCNLAIVLGSVMTAADVERAITPDVDAVICVLSPAKGAPSDLLPVAVGNIIRAMQRQGIRRLIHMTGAGVAMPQDRPKLVDRAIKVALQMQAGAVLRQSEAAARLVEDSGLDWTILRAPRLTNGPHSGHYRVGWAGVNTGPMLSRADAADFILKQTASRDYLHMAPAVSN